MENLIRDKTIIPHLSEFNMDPVCPLDYRYGRKKVKDLFGEEQRLQLLLDVEAALARAHAKVGNIPKKAAEEITKKASTKFVKKSRVKEIEAETKHDIMAVTKALAEQCNKDAGKYIHLGATSYDIVDTANALQFAKSTEIINEGLEKLRKTLAKIAEEHKKTIMVGRTHGQQTIPITFGLKIAGYTMEIHRHLERLDEIKKRLFVGKLSGAVGTGAALGEKALELQKIMLNDLNLDFEDVSTQIVCRDRYNELISLLANIATSLEKFATEIRNLQRDEIKEAAEAFEKEKQVGSSTMPHKKNPITSEQICGLARVVRSYLTPTFENSIQWHERDLCNSSSERFILSHSIILTDWIIQKTINVFENIQVFPENMKKNLDVTKKLPMAEAMMSKLVEKGMGRGEAHEIMRKISLEAAQKDKSLEEVFIDHNKKMKILREEEIKQTLDPKNYLGSTSVIIDNALKKIKRS
ncbi:MAG: adenylosuccinate lyase [Candidatus Thermoplasmatota archaeon]